MQTLKQLFDGDIITTRQRVLWLVMFLFSLLGMCDIPGSILFAIKPWLQWCIVIAISTLKGLLWVIVLEIGRRWIITQILIWAIAIIYALLCLVNFISLSFYDFGISHRLILIIFQTNQSELTEFLPGLASNIVSSLFSPRITLNIIIILSFSLIVLKINGRILCFSILILSIVGLVAFIWSIQNVPHGKNSFLMLIRASKTILETMHENRQAEAILSSLQPYGNASQVSSDHKAETLVMIVGESASKAHLSLYGYPLVTSPGMDKMADSLIVFSNAIGATTGTAGNLERILTLKKDSDNNPWWNYPMIMDIFKAAGYMTYWISNQERSGIWSNGSGVIASRADEVCYVGKISSEDALLQKYDEVLIPELDRIISDTLAYPKFVGVNLMGSHTMYKLRYPQSHSIFTADDIKHTLTRKWMTKSKYRTVAEYDNSIHYTDSIICTMIDMVGNMDKPAILLYFSDHGENVYDDRDFIGRDKKFVDVPLIIYANSSYRKANLYIIEALQASNNRKMSTANIIHALLTITGTQCLEYNDTYDFLSPSYVERPRIVDEDIYIYARE